MSWPGQALAGVEVGVDSGEDQGRRPRGVGPTGMAPSARAARRGPARLPADAVDGVDFDRRPDEPARFTLQARPGGPLRTTMRSPRPLHGCGDRYDPSARTYAYRIRSTLDVGRLGNTQVTVDADTGPEVAFTRPTGGARWTTFTTWIEELHEAGVWRWPMQLLLSVVGVGVAALGATGVLVWARKRRARV